MTTTDIQTIERARADLIAAIEGAGLDNNDNDPGDSDGLVKVGRAGLSIELRFNGETIPLDGKDVNQLAPDAFEAFLEQQKRKLENGDLDDAIARALQAPGPGKALARVRALDESEFPSAD